MSSAMPRRSIVGPVTYQHHTCGLSFNHLQLSRSILPHTSIQHIHTLHLRSVVHQVEMLLYRIHTIHLRSVVHQMEMFLHRINIIHLHRIHTLLPQLVVHRVVLLLNHIHTLHLRHIHTLHLNMFAPEVVTTQVAGRIPLIQLKFL
jgi:hypothetical protein